MNIFAGKIHLYTSETKAFVLLIERRESIVLFSDTVEGTTPKDVMDLLVLTQYFDTLHEIGNNAATKVIFLPGEQQAMRNAIMEGEAANA